MTKYRNYLQIVADILSAVNTCTRKSHIMYKTNLNYKILCQYLDKLLNAGLVRISEEGYYEITAKGRSFLRHYASFLKYSKHFEKNTKIVEEVKEKLEELYSPKT